MRRAALALSLIVAAPVVAQERQIEDVIDRQLDAFRQDDFASAFAHASPSIQALFGSPERFGTMVREGYPMIHRPGEVRYLGLETLGEVQRQTVLIRDSGGAYHVVEYEMVRIDGAWRINGVRVIEAPQVGA